MNRRRRVPKLPQLEATIPAIPLPARLRLVSGFRKRIAALLLLVTLLLGGLGGAAATAGRVAWMWVAGSAATTAVSAVVAARPRAIGPVRYAGDGTMFQDFDNGQTLITHPNGSWSVVATDGGRRRRG